MEVTSDGLWDWDITTDTVYYSPACAQMIGCQPHELSGRIESWMEKIIPEDRARVIDAKRQCIRGAIAAFNLEYRIESKHEGQKWILARGMAVDHDEHGHALRLVGKHQDITERKAREEALELKNLEMERFTYMVSHDLKSPLVTVSTFLGYLKQDLRQGKAERAEKDIQFIGDAADKMAILLEDLLEVSRVGRVLNPPVTVAFADLARSAVQAVGGAIAARGAAVILEASPATLSGDRPRLEEIWQNLVENAVKYMGDQPAPRIILGAKANPEATVFFVKDNGMGIDPRFQGKIFGLFEQLDPNFAGTGLGLALVKRIVEHYAGRIWVESDGCGMGSCFRFTLPAAERNVIEGAP
jgi:PAS domain S-box-containing protein